MKPRQLAAAALFVCMGMTVPTMAQSRPFGLGFIVGEPMGGTMKVWFNSYIGLDFAAGADFGYPSRYLFRYGTPPAYQMHVELLGHIPFVRTRGPRMPIYIGGGAKFNWWHGNFEARARTPIGLALLLPRRPFPWEIFFEFAPTWGARPRLFDPDAAMGMRYYF
ncbi:MAG: hypothetical protein GF331_09800 [Chitinivibrionales bacterium]|nr:hypothetical protein [Chitinivibrionales bacterium]